MGAAPELLIHLHVPKCAGAAINLALDRVHRGRVLGGPVAEAIAKLDALSVAERDATYDVVLGHHVWGIHERFGRPFVCFSATRDPLERICSYFNYIHTRPDHPLHRLFKQCLPDLGRANDDDLACHPFFALEWKNYFCRVYGGGPTSADDFVAVEAAVAERMADGTLVVGALPHILAFLRGRGLLEGELARYNVTEVEGRDDFVPATVAGLGASMEAKLRAWNALDYRLLAMIERRNEAGEVALAPRLG